MALEEILGHVLSDGAFHGGQQIEIALAHLRRYFESYMQKLPHAAVV